MTSAVCLLVTQVVSASRFDYWTLPTSNPPDSKVYLCIWSTDCQKDLSCIYGNSFCSFPSCCRARVWLRVHESSPGRQIKLRLNTWSGSCQRACKTENARYHPWAVCLIQRWIVCPVHVPKSIPYLTHWPTRHKGFISDWSSLCSFPMFCQCLITVSSTISRALSL